MAALLPAGARDLLEHRIDVRQAAFNVAAKRKSLTEPRPDIRTDGSRAAGFP